MFVELEQLVQAMLGQEVRCDVLRRQPIHAELIARVQPRDLLQQEVPLPHHAARQVALGDHLPQNPAAHAQVGADKI